MRSASNVVLLRAESIPLAFLTEFVSSIPIEAESEFSISVDFPFTPRIDRVEMELIPTSILQSFS